MVFAIVCDVCNAPMGYWVPDTGMARCTDCLWENPQPEPEYDPTDDPCTWGEHDWKEVFDGGCFECQRCGLLDC